jgi:hypothetical protein
VNTNRRKITSALFLGLILGWGARVSFAQEDVKSNGSAKTPADAKAGKPKDYGVIFGTAYGPDDRPMYGVRVTIHPVGKKHPNWDLFSDHRGEFAQRVPPVPADYLVTGEVEVAPVENGKPRASKKKRLRGETKVHIDGTEWRDFSLHLSE